MESINTIQSKIDQLTFHVKEIFQACNTQKIGNPITSTNRISLEINLDTFDLSEFESKLPLIKQILNEYAVLKKQQDKMTVSEQKVLLETNAVGKLPGLNSKVPF